jgi:hypothetical protein
MKGKTFDEPYNSAAKQKLKEEKYHFGEKRRRIPWR